MVIIMTINQIIKDRGMTKYKVAKLSGVPHTTLNDICSGKTRIEKCTAETIYKLAQVLGISMEYLIENSLISRDEQSQRERSYEYGLPAYLQHDLDAFKDGLANNSTLMDCLWGELYGSINMAEISEGVITHEHAEYLRDKYLRGTIEYKLC